MNNWNIKITEVGTPMVGFGISIESNGEVIMTPKNIYKNLDRAIDDAQKIIKNRVEFWRLRNKRASLVNDMFVKKFINSRMYNGVYRSGIKIDTKGNPYLEVTMDTDNSNLDKLIPNAITDPKTKLDYKIVKVKPVTNANANPIV